MDSKIALVGIGSVLMGDDGFGPWFIRRFASRWEVEGAAVEDLGTPGPELAHRILDLEALILVDALRLPGARPGDVRTYDRAAILHHGPDTRRSAHDPNLRDALLTADLADRGPQSVLLVGVVPERIELGAPRSAAVEHAADRVEDEVVRELRRLGCRVERRATPETLEIWWDEAPRVVGPPAGGEGPRSCPPPPERRPHELRPRY